MAYPTHLEFLRERLGSKWCVAPRMTDRLRRAGHEVAIPKKRYDELWREWATNHPAYLIVAALPDSEHKPMILKAVLRELY